MSKVLTQNCSLIWEGDLDTSVSIICSQKDLDHTQFNCSSSSLSLSLALYPVVPSLSCSGSCLFGELQPFPSFPSSLGLPSLLALFLYFLSPTPLEP